MDISEELKNVENTLRDFITWVLYNKNGDNWFENCGLSSDQIEKIKERREKEKKTQKGGPIEQRLIYYSDLFHLKTIINKNWNSQEFPHALGDKKTIEVFLYQLECVRNPEAHRRELLPHQKYLIIGIAGEIRNRIMRYRSKQETGEAYFPRIEQVSDNLGNQYVPPHNGTIETGQNLRVRDKLTYTVSATDPMGGKIEYAVKVLRASGRDIIWQKDNNLEITLNEKEIGKKIEIQIRIRSLRDYHAFRDYDDIASFRYEVLPPVSEDKN